MANPWDGATPTDVPDIWENTSGYFFVDESYEFHGPYSTQPDAIIALDAYVEYLNNGPKAGNTQANLPQSTVKYYGG